jgi:Holliday junction DNA helicase RuvA
VASGDYESLTLHEEVKLYTHHHVREQAEDLYGFSSLAGKRLFEMLITVQGVGPKAALAILSLGRAEVVRNAIAYGDSAYVQGASGVGKKTAERVVVDLKDKVGAPGLYDLGAVAPAAGNDDALDALIALGFPLASATEMLRDVDGNLSVDERIKHALKRKS